jgi:hypothetical protein
MCIYLLYSIYPYISTVEWGIYMEAMKEGYDGVGMGIWGMDGVGMVCMNQCELGMACHMLT